MRIFPLSLRYNLRGLSVMLFAGLVGNLLNSGMWAQGCSAQQAAVDRSREKIKATVEGIKRLDVNIADSDLEELEADAKQGMKKTIEAATLSVLDGFLNAPEAALGTKSIAEYKLKNGLGSIGTGQGNAIIGRLRAQGGVKLALIPAIRKLSQISDKTSTLEFLNLLSGTAQQLKAVLEGESAKNSLEETEALFALAAAVTGKGDLAVSLASAIVNYSYNQTQIYLMAQLIDQLTETNQKQLDGN